MEARSGGGDRMWTVEELREYLNIGRTKARELVYRDEIPAVKIGRSVRIRERDVEEYLNRNAYFPSSTSEQAGGDDA